MGRPDLDGYRASLEKVRRDLLDRLDEQEAVHQRLDELREEISALRRIVAGLSDYCGVPNEKWIGLTEACSEVMAQQETTVSTNEVVKALEDMGIDMGAQKNASASIHAILTRLAKRGEIIKVDDGKNVTWKGPKFDPDYIPF